MKPQLQGGAPYRRGAPALLPPLQIVVVCMLAFNTVLLIRRKNNRPTDLSQGSRDPAEWKDYLPTSLEPITVPSLNYRYPLCPWITNNMGYPRVGPSGPWPLSSRVQKCVDRLVNWARQGKTTFSLDGGGLLAAVTSGGHDQGVDDLDFYLVSETGLAKDSYSHCPEIRIGQHAMIWLPKQLEVGKEAYREAFAEHADRFCTCEFGGPFLCIKTALDDKPTEESLGFGPGNLDLSGPTWADRLWEHRKPTRLDDDRGSAFWSVKYLFGPSYWIPPSEHDAGKDLSPNRARLFTVPGTGHWGAHVWVESTVTWCDTLYRGAVTDPSQLTIKNILQAADQSVQELKVNPFWLNRMMSRSPCFLINARDFMDYTCKYFAHIKAARSQGEAAQKKVYEEYHLPPLKSLDESSPDQAVCLQEILVQTCGSSEQWQGKWVTGTKPSGYAYQCVPKA